MLEPMICGAIRERRLLAFTYEDHRRVVEPHLLGYYVGGDLTLVAWQVSGGDRGEGWRDFGVQSMHSATLASGTFKGPRPGYDPADATIEEVVCSL